MDAKLPIPEFCRYQSIFPFIQARSCSEWTKQLILAQGLENYFQSVSKGLKCRKEFIQVSWVEGQKCYYGASSVKPFFNTCQTVWRSVCTGKNQRGAASFFSADEIIRVGGREKKEETAPDMKSCSTAAAAESSTQLELDKAAATWNGRNASDTASFVSSTQSRPKKPLRILEYTANTAIASSGSAGWWCVCGGCQVCRPGQATVGPRPSDDSQIDSTSGMWAAWWLWGCEAARKTTVIL